MPEKEFLQMQHGALLQEEQKRHQLFREPKTTFLHLPAQQMRCLMINEDPVSIKEQGLGTF